jgi:hypothetical protein
MLGISLVLKIQILSELTAIADSSYGDARS